MFLSQYYYMRDTSEEGFASVLLHPRVDQMLEIVSKRPRRLVLLLLQQETIELTNNGIGYETSEPAVPNIELTHSHLPKLEAAGYIEWDRETSVISKGPHFDEIESFLGLIENHTDELPPGWP